MATQTLVKEICPTTTQSWIQRGALLLDVREANEVARMDFDVPHILHIPLSEFEERFQEVPRELEVVVACQHGSRSLRAAAFLINHGYEKVVNMEYGLARWLQKGFPVTADIAANTQSSGCCSPAPDNGTSACCGDDNSSGACC